MKRHFTVLMSERKRYLFVSCYTITTICVLLHREWKDGLFASLLRKFCVQPPNHSYATKIKPVMKIMQLDGEV